MNSLVEFLGNPLLWKIVVTFWVFSAFVGALETPKPEGNPYYRFAFRFLHILAGNLNRAALKFGAPGASPDQGPPAA